MACLEKGCVVPQMTMTRPDHYFTQSGTRKTITWKHRLKSDGEKVAGLNEDGNITINLDKQVSAQAATLFHELIHEARKAPVHIRGDELELDEVCTLTIETNLVIMWRSNRKLFDWIHANMGELS